MEGGRGGGRKRVGEEVFMDRHDHLDDVLRKHTKASIPSVSGVDLDIKSRDACFTTCCASCRSIHWHVPQYGRPLKA
jgi:hypothetical protein